jgi:hypothetical protein
METIFQEEVENNCVALQVGLVGTEIDHPRFGLVEVLEESPKLLRVSAREAGHEFWIPKSPSKKYRRLAQRLEKPEKAVNNHVTLFSRPGTFYLVSHRFEKARLLDIEGNEFLVERSDIKQSSKK